MPEVRVPEPYLILVTVPTQHDLVALSCHLTAQGIAHRVFQEEDLGGRPTALATRPIAQHERKYFRSLPLYQGVRSSTAEHVAAM
jgi:hypothetical protein